jgi:hypothetical protein
MQAIQWNICLLNSNQSYKVIPQGDCSFVIPVTSKMRLVVTKHQAGHISSSRQHLKIVNGRNEWHKSEFSWPDSIEAGLLRCIGMIDYPDVKRCDVLRTQTLLLTLLEKLIKVAA